MPRFWLTPTLCLAAAVAAALPLINPSLGAPPVPFFWPVVTTTAGALWLVDRWRWTTRLILVVTAVVFGWLAVSSQYPSTRQAEDAPGGEVVTGVGKALMGVGAATWTQGVTLLLVAAAFICSCGPARPGRIGGRSLVAATLVLVGVIAAAVPAGLGVRSASQAATRSRAETITRYDPANTDGVHSDVQAGNKRGWSRTGLRDAMPAGDLTIGVRGNEVLGLRSSDGAARWRYQVTHDKSRHQIRDVVVDSDAHTVLVRVDNVLVGIRFDGHITYHTRLADPGRFRSLRHLIDLGSIHGGHRSTTPTLSRAAIAVFANRRTDSYTGYNFAYGYAVSTGNQQWRVETESDRCEITATADGDTVHVVTAGKSPCRTRILRFDGATQRYDTELEPPPEARTSPQHSMFARPHGSHRHSTPYVYAAGSDSVAVQPSWLGKPGRDSIFRTQLVDADGNIGGTLSQAPLSGDAYADSLLIPVHGKAHNGSRFGMLDTDHKHGRLGWALLDQKLRQKSVTWLPGPQYPKVRQLGRHYLDLIDDNGRHHISRIDDQLSAVETIDSPGTCRSETSTWAAGDDQHLVLGCRDTITVRPIT